MLAGLCMTAGKISSHAVERLEAQHHCMQYDDALTHYTLAATLNKLLRPNFTTAAMPSSNFRSWGLCKDMMSGTCKQAICPVLIHTQPEWQLGMCVDVNKTLRWAKRTVVMAQQAAQGYSYGVPLNTTAFSWQFLFLQRQACRCTLWCSWQQAIDSQVGGGVKAPKKATTYTAWDDFVSYLLISTL